MTPWSNIGISQFETSHTAPGVYENAYISFCHLSCAGGDLIDLHKLLLQGVGLSCGAKQYSINLLFLVLFANLGIKQKITSMVQMQIKNQKCIQECVFHCMLGLGTSQLSASTQSCRAIDKCNNECHYLFVAHSHSSKVYSVIPLEHSKLHQELATGEKHPWKIRYCSDNYNFKLAQCQIFILHEDEPGNWD